MSRTMWVLLLACASTLHAATTIWAGTEGGIYKSVDGGATWEPVAVSVTNPLLQGSEPQTPNVAALALDPHQPSTIYFAGQMRGSSGNGFYRSTDNGKTWSATVLIGVPIGAPISFQTTWVLVDPVMTNVVYLGYSGGILRSTDYGATFSKLNLPVLPNTGGTTAAPDGLSLDPNAPGVLYLSALLRVFRSTDFGDTWTLLGTVTPVANAVRLGNVVVTPGDGRVIYVGNSGAGAPLCGQGSQQLVCGLFRSGDGGQTWKNVAPAGEYHEVVFDAAGSTLYVSGGLTGLGGAILKSTDGGNTWTPISNKVNPLLVSDPGSASNLFGYQWGNNAWFRSSDNGSTFSTGFIVTTGLSRSVNNLTVPRRVGFVSAASFRSGPVAAESIVSALGFNLATTSLGATTSPAPTELGGTTVTVVDAAGTPRPAPLFYVSPGQVNYEIPAGTAPGVAIVTVKSGDGAISRAPLGIIAVAPALFTLNESSLAAAYALRISGGGQIYENVYQVDSANKVNARPIDLGPASDQVYLLLYGTGLRGASDVTATVGGVSVPVLYAGAQGQFAGEDQVNLGPLPRSLAGSGSVPVVLSAGGKTANPVNVTIR